MLEKIDSFVFGSLYSTYFLLTSFLYFIHSDVCFLSSELRFWSDLFGTFLSLLFISLQSAFLFGVVWSIGGLTDYEGRQKFDQFLKELINGKNEQNPIPKLIGKIEVPFPEAGTVYDFTFEVSLVLLQLTYELKIDKLSQYTCKN